MKKLIMTIGTMFVAGAMLAATPIEIANLPSKEFATAIATVNNKVELFEACLQTTNKLQGLPNAWKLTVMTSNVEWQVRVADAVVDCSLFRTNTNQFFRLFARNILCWNNLQNKNDTELLRICDKALDVKDYITATAAIFAYQPISATCRLPAESNAIKAWKQANAKEIFDGLKSLGGFASKLRVPLLQIMSKYDFNLDGSYDTESTYAMTLFDPDMFGDNALPFYRYALCEKTVLGRAMRDAYFSKATLPHEILHAIDYSIKPTERKEKILQFWPTISKDPTVAIKAALFLNDVDKIIDVLVVSTDNLDAATINAIIMPLNSVDSDYRKADILKILKNINSKYTIKLYDDRDVWEPILSKVRAMLDVRQ